MFYIVRGSFSIMADAKQDVNESPAPSRLVLAKPRLGGFGTSSFNASGSKTNNPFGSVLRPPQLKPTLSNNPFVKVTSEDDGMESTDKPKEGNNKEDRLKDSEPEPPKFVPLGTVNATSRNNNVPATQPAPSSSAGFVFGQNLSERVVIKDSINNGEASANDHSSSNGTNTFLFTNAVASAKDNNQEEAPTSEGTNEGLAAAAAEYERSHAKPLPPTSNNITTGEEEECNVLQISCRLFAWEGGSWRERGRVVLRLNDAAVNSTSPSAVTGSRLVARVVGSLRLVLNTKLWPKMVTERAGNKSLRITAMDAQHQVKLFLIMGVPADISQLHRAMSSRIANCSRTTKSQDTTNDRLDNDTNDANAAKEFADNYVDPEESSSSDKKDEELGTKTLVFERIDTQDKTEDKDSLENASNERDENKAQKRKEADVGEETSPKRQCPDILID